MIINDDFEPTRGRDKRLPPGQYETRDFPVLSLGPTPEVSTDEWKLEISGLVDHPLTFSWEEFLTLPIEEVKKDIHCVTKWSKFDTQWEGVSLDELMRRAGVSERATHLIAHSHDGYSTNLPIEDVTGGKAWVAVRYEGEEIAAEHGGPARLLVPHLYFWKSAKWLKKLEFVDHDIPGFWEVRGYHNYGDPWQEQRYTFD
ncbi:MAG TPA: sulfite oxidase-like oxidoreductase [Candidatus Paceibacterota bacterium]|nr:sulfite oxidase-like oxidoreductase [Candidatus Paceibacterota bacterium]